MKTRYSKISGKNFTLITLLLLSFLMNTCPAWAEGKHLDNLRQLLAAYEGKSAAYVLEKGEESLMARAWLAGNAEKSIDVQYFIWSSDNIGILATEALLTAAERGVSIRVIVDDLLVDADDETLLALAAHPNVNIRIYNPKHKVGTSKIKRIFNLFSDFRASNQRMHDKTVIVDNLIAITGGRNMADEYYDYDQEYNFRDRDILLFGPVAEDMESSFERFWKSKLSVPVEKLIGDPEKGLKKKTIQAKYKELHDYAKDSANFAPNVRQALENLPQRFDKLVRNLTWDDMRFISDLPGKNEGKEGLKGGGKTTTAIVEELKKAKKSITIQSPYLVMPDEGIELFKELIKKGVRVRINTNSLLSTDNILAFSGYSKKRKKLVKAGIEIYEYKPQPEVMKELIDRYKEMEKEPPIFAIHAKTLIIDSETLYIGTFNLDPRSVNLNTEVGVLINNPSLARQVEENIERDMSRQNSWAAHVKHADSRSSIFKRMKVGFLKLLPMEPVL
ncbi:MAG: phospholipase D family protein [Deltaproteobacteria bacterium]|nr:phospholipase D family protein [Deltaproteobacteria bacterium]